MKKILYVLLAFSIGMCIAPAFAAEPTAPQQLAKTLDKTVDYATKSTDSLALYAKEQAEAFGGVVKVAGKKTYEVLEREVPEVIHQFLVWKFVESFVIFLAFLSAAGAFMYTNLRKVDGSDGDGNTTRQTFQSWTLTSPQNNDPWFFIPAFMWAGFGVCMYNATLHLTWLKIWLAPKVYLIEYGLSLFSK